jgi:hypothetical protein
MYHTGQTAQAVNDFEVERLTECVCGPKRKAKEITVLQGVVLLAAAIREVKETASKTVSAPMELAVHRPWNTKLPRPESKAAIKLSGACERFKARSSEANDLFEVAGAKYIATDPGLTQSFRALSSELCIWPLFTSERTAGRGPRNGDFLGLFHFDDAQASYEATSKNYSPADGRWNTREPESPYPPRVGERPASRIAQPSLERSLCSRNSAIGLPEYLKSSPEVTQTRQSPN